MPAPSIYSEADLATFMHTTLAEVAGDLGFTDPDSYEEAVNDVALALGVDDVADETDIGKVRAFARQAAWQRALTAAAVYYDMADGTQSLKRSQIFDRIKAALAEAQTVASGYADATPGYEVGVLKVVRTEDPYIDIPDLQRVP